MRHQLRLSRLNTKLAYLLLASVLGLSASSATSCVHPCPAAQCTQVDPSSCPYGLVKDVCECCDVCGNGPGQLCGANGKCGEGLICVPVQEGLAEYPSFCQQAPTSTATTAAEVVATTTEATQSPTTTQSPTATAPSPVTNPPSNCSNSSTAPEPASGMPDTCRQPCSVSFCSDRARICSAAGLEFRKVARRNGCQHTSCNACFLLVRPNCDRYKCIDPPNKRCLREYYECIRDHYFSPPQESSYPVIMRLDDARAPSWDGEIICHIPEVEDDVWSAG